MTGSNWYSSWRAAVSQSELVGYTGRETGDRWWFYRARYYDATTGRFLSEDPIRSVVNAYSYVANDPVDATDPTGMVIRRCYRSFSSTTNKILGALALASIFGAVQPPVPGTRLCPMHEYLFNTDTGQYQGYDPKEKARETGKNICYDIPEPLGTCVWANFEKVHGPMSDYKLMSHNCQTTINDTVNYCTACLKRAAR
jgi:RHS repeat-associated protein